MSDYIITNNGELYHYGVKGMKWGIRRSADKLRSKSAKLQKQNSDLRGKIKTLQSKDDKYTRKSAEYRKSNSKYEARLAKATAKKAKYDAKLYRATSKRNIDVDKVGKYTAKSAKYEQKIAQNAAKIKYNKWQVKADSVREAARQAKVKIEKNERLMSTYSKTITAMDNDKIKQGRVFMQYVVDDD